MPRMDSPETDKLKLVKLLLCGDSKAGKSFYAGMAAQKFNVLYLDGDVAIQTLNALPIEAKRNTYLMSVGDRTLDGRIDYNFSDFLTQFFTSSKLIWDDTNQKIVTRRDDVSESEVWEITPPKLDSNTVLVLDSWTTAAMSATQWAADACGVELQDTTTTEMRQVYQAINNKATQWMRILQALPCHVIVIAHPDEMVKTVKPTGRVGSIKETDHKIEWVKMVPKSVSRPHSLTLAKHFTDVAWLTTNATGSRRYIDFRVSDDRIAGGHVDQRYEVEEFWFDSLVREVGGIVPESLPEPAWLTMHAKGEYTPAGAAGKPLDSAKAGTVKTAASSNQASRGLASLLNKGAQ